MFYGNQGIAAYPSRPCIVHRAEREESACIAFPMARVPDCGPAQGRAAHGMFVPLGLIAAVSDEAERIKN